jgi:hypothetical protein
MVCRVWKIAGYTDKQAAFAARRKELDEYQATSTYDDVRFERHVRTYLRNLGKLTKANEGSGKPCGISDR